MLIKFKSKALEKEFCNEKTLKRRWGVEQAKLIARRLTELAAAENLETLRKLPHVRAHELSGDRAG
jgi:proteic killer suppression protein